jgi:hypothetical protein
MNSNPIKNTSVNKERTDKDQPASRDKAARPPRSSPSASSTAQRRAAVILEVLGGVRTVPEAARTLGICTNHYYLLERKALAGLVAACEPQAKGKRPDPEKQLASIRQALERSERECQRQAALVRATQRALNLPAPPPDRASSATARRKDGKPRRNRKKSVRALRAAENLVSEATRQTDAAALEPAKDQVDKAIPREQEHSDGGQEPHDDA